MGETLWENQNLPSYFAGIPGDIDLAVIVVEEPAKDLKCVQGKWMMPFNPCCYSSPEVIMNLPLTRHNETTRILCREDDIPMLLN